MKNKTETVEQKLDKLLNHFELTEFFCEWCKREKMGKAFECPDIHYRIKMCRECWTRWCNGGGTHGEVYMPLSEEACYYRNE